MKRYTSRFLKSLAALLIGFPVGYLVTVALLFDVPAASLVGLTLSPWYWILSALAMSTGYGLWEMKRWAWYFFLLTVVATGYANAVIALEMGESHHRALAFLLSLFALGALVFRVAREVRVPYFLPKIRWWESNPRYRLSVPVSLSRQNGETLQGEVLDLSASGCFIKLRTDLLQDELVTLAFTIFGQPVQISGTIVWRTASAVTHPKGVGLKFGPIPRPQKRVFRGIKRRLREITRLYRTGRYLMAEDEYSKRLKELQTRPLQ